MLQKTLDLLDCHTSGRSVKKTPLKQNSGLNVIYRYRLCMHVLQ